MEIPKIHVKVLESFNSLDGALKVTKTIDNKRLQTLPVSDLRSELRHAHSELTQRGLLISSKWYRLKLKSFNPIRIAELLSGLPPSETTGKIPPKENSLLDLKFQDLLLLAKSYFDLKDFLACYEILTPFKEETSGVGSFLRVYSAYLVFYNNRMFYLLTD